MTTQCERLCMRNLYRDSVHLWLRLDVARCGPESGTGADRVVPVRRSLQLRRDVHLQQLPARERAHRRGPVMHAGQAASLFGSV